MKPEHIITLLAILVLLGAAIWGGYSYGQQVANRQADEAFAALLDDIAYDHEQVVTTRNRQVQTLQEALHQSQGEISTQADLIRKLKDKPAEVRYITKVETKLVPVHEPITLPTTEPFNHLFALQLPSGELVVARATLTAEGEIELETYEQKWQLDAVLGESSSSFLLQATSGYDGEPVEVPVEVDVTYITEEPYRLVSPRVGLGLTLGVGIPQQDDSFPIQPAFGGHLSLMWLYPHERISVLSPRIGLSNRSVRGGLDVVQGNLGGRRGMFRDLWLGVGASYGTDMMPAVELTLTTRL